jgi:hypothetical protein
MFVNFFYFTYMTLFQDLIAENIRLRARVGVLEETVAALEAKLAEATATTGLWQYLLAGMGGALVLELLARPVWIRCTGKPFPLDQLLDKTEPYRGESPGRLSSGLGAYSGRRPLRAEKAPIPVC